MRQVPDWNEYYMTIAKAVSQRSKDPRTQVGCVIINRDFGPISFGYNGFPSGVTETEERWGPIEKYNYVVHAEVNAILNAAKEGVSTKDAVVYVTLFPCGPCALQLIQAGVKHIWYNKEAQDARLKERPEFVDSFNFAAELFDDAGVTYHGI